MGQLKTHGNNVLGSLSVDDQDLAGRTGIVEGPRLLGVVCWADSVIFGGRERGRDKKSRVAFQDWPQSDPNSSILTCSSPQHCCDQISGLCFSYTRVCDRYLSILTNPWGVTNQTNPVKLHCLLCPHKTPSMQVNPF